MSHRGTHCANIRTNVGLSHFFQSLFIAMFEVFSSSILRRKNRKKMASIRWKCRESSLNLHDYLHT